MRSGIGGMVVTERTRPSGVLSRAVARVGRPGYYREDDPKNLNNSGCKALTRAVELLKRFAEGDLATKGRALADRGIISHLLGCKACVQKAPARLVALEGEFEQVINVIRGKGVAFSLSDVDPRSNLASLLSVETREALKAAVKKLFA